MDFADWCIPLNSRTDEWKRSAAPNSVGTNDEY